MKDQKKVTEGDPVIYVDALGAEHSALVTRVWGPMMGDEVGLNVVFVNPDEDMNDTYGRQIMRETSVVHKTNQPAHGQYWKRIGE
jgi:hypothetical protein